jgi:hypothetical protein
MTDPSETPQEHDWIDPGDLYPRLRMYTSSGDIILSCRKCGVIQGERSLVKPCPGVVHVELR